MKLSVKNNSDPKMKHIKSNTKWWTRIICLLLAVLMIVLAAAALIQMLSLRSYAYANDMVLTEDGTDYLVAVGLMYADGVTVGFETSAQYGFSVGSIANAGDTKHRVTALWQITDVTKISVTCDANLSKTGMTYSISDGSNVAIGGYHVQLNTDYMTLVSQLSSYQAIASSYGMNAFPAYVNGTYCIRFGSFAGANEALIAQNTLLSAGISAQMVEPSITGVSVVDPLTDRILFEYDCGEVSSLGLQALQSGIDPTYLITPAQNSYDGTFKYTRYRSGAIDGVAVTNVLPLEDYLLGVLPWEVGTSCAIDVQRAFAVAARSYAMSSVGKHSTFDICNSTCCQVYKGLNRTTDATIQAVNDTHGQVLTYQGTICRTVYSSSVGGTTVSAEQAWGSSTAYKYLTAIVTPWEKYEDCYRGVWTQEYSPAVLANRLRANGYSQITGDIADVKIDSLCDNSTYVYKITFTDTYGNTATVQRSDKIRTLLGLSSANFVVGKAGETVTAFDYSLTDEGLNALINSADSSGGSIGNVEGGAYVLTSSNSTPTVMNVGESIVTVSANERKATAELTRLAVMTQNGMLNFNLSELANSTYFTLNDVEIVKNDIANRYPQVSQLVTDVIKTEREVYLEGTPGNFVFSGRGWGHGVGMSQYGAMYLAELGYGYETLLTTYYQGTAIMNLRDVIASVSENMV